MHTAIRQKVQDGTATKEELLLLLNLPQYTKNLNEKLSEMKVQRQSELEDILSAFFSSKEIFTLLESCHKMEPHIHQLLMDFAIRKHIPDQIIKAL